MTQRLQVTFHDHNFVIGSLADRAAIHRVARRIFSRHLNEGNPINWEQAKVDAERAWWEVHAMAKREVAA